MEFRLADISAPPGSQMIPEEDRIIIEGGAGHFSTPASLWMKRMREEVLTSKVFQRRKK